MARSACHSRNLTGSLGKPITEALKALSVFKKRIFKEVTDHLCVVEFTKKLDFITINYN